MKNLKLTHVLGILALTVLAMVTYPHWTEWTAWVKESYITPVLLLTLAVCVVVLFIRVKTQRVSSIYKGTSNYKSIKNKRY